MRCFVIKEYYYSLQAFAYVRVASSEEFEQEVIDMQIKHIVDQFEKKHPVSDMPKLGKPHACETGFNLLKLCRPCIAAEGHPFQQLW